MRKFTSSLLVEAKKKKKKKNDGKGDFTYEGETFSTNPFAVCNDKIDKKEEPKKWERCVQHVKSKTKK